MKPTFIIDQTSVRTPYYNLALEEAISLKLVSEGFIGGLRFWENPRSIVIGLSEKPERTVGPFYESFLQNRKEQPFPKKPIDSETVYIARRASGGGTVVHEPGWNLNFSIFVSLKEKPELFPVGNSYKTLLGLVSNALRNQNIQSNPRGKSDLAVGQETEMQTWKKISGNAQFRKRDCIVQHGTLILDPRLIELVGSYLPHPPEEPDYRKGRDHKEFVTSLPPEFKVGKFKQDLALLFADYLGVEKIGTGKEFLPFLRTVFLDADRLFKEKYGTKRFLTGEE
ncbi:lipoate--protein ligase [Leptospira perolatii]|uniref:Lipoate--protein ligase n=1 Tax=Leptospira perolatii TaxID=2023191 RepID=A0A2M9ZIV2_9LEPT|nr:lipoate--protein ligase family protein [Leptospira perolatii]PJZ68650.1 lipoate--protein ligase [Leptospira perolatii]PJZ71997.1 lipoate--protein ligase [Leptospira perolatii]